MNVLHARAGRRWVVLAVLVLAAAVVAALLVAGCGSSTTTTSSSSPAASPSTSATGAAAWTPADLAAIKPDPSLKAMLPSSITSSNNLRVASDIPYPPWEYYDPPTSKNPAGFDFDLSQAIGAKIGIPTSFNEVPFDSIILNIKAGKNDMIMSDMYDNKEREQSGITFVDYALDGTSILVKKGNPSGVSGLDSLAGQTVACESGTTQQAFLETLNKQFASAGKAKMSILALPNQPAALLAVSSGRAIGDLTDHSTAAYIAQTTNNGATFEVVADPAAPDGYVPQMTGIGIVSTNTGLIQAVQKALQDLIDEGSYQKIVAKYGLLPVDSAQINAGPAYAAAHAAAPVP